MRGRWRSGGASWLSLLPPPLRGRVGVGGWGGGVGGGERGGSKAARTAMTPTPHPSPQGGGELPNVGAILSLAYPDRLAKNRGKGAFTLVNGRGGNIDQASPLAREPFIVVAELTGSAGHARIVLAAPIAPEEIEARFGNRAEDRDDVTFEEKSLSLRARRSRRLGAIALVEQTRKVEPNYDTARALAEGIARIGIAKLPWTKALTQWRDRVMFLRKAEGDEWPDLSDTALSTNVEWLVPAFAGKTSVAQLSGNDLSSALTELLPWPLRRRLDAEAPTHFDAPTGTRAAIDYEANAGPTISIRLQELFGLAQHPTIAGGRIPLVIELLSPGQKPVQITRDLPGFWRGSYAAVRTEMRGRYPRHPWPDDPLAAVPTRRAKPRGT